MTHHLLQRMLLNNGAQSASALLHFLYYHAIITVRFSMTSRLKVIRFDSGTEHLSVGKEWNMLQMLLFSIVGGILACAAWDGMKALWRLMR